MATTKSTSTRTTRKAKATATKKPTTKKEDIKMTIQLTPAELFCKTPGSQAHSVKDNQRNPLFQKECLNENLKIYKPTNQPLISNNYQTYWTTPNGDLIQIILKTKQSYKDKENKTKEYSPIKSLIRNAFSQLNLEIYSKLDDIKDIKEALIFIKANGPYTFNINKENDKTYYNIQYNKVLKPQELPEEPDYLEPELQDDNI